MRSAEQEARRKDIEFHEQFRQQIVVSCVFHFVPLGGGASAALVRLLVFDGNFLGIPR